MGNKKKKAISILNPALVNLKKGDDSKLTDDEFKELREIAVEARIAVSKELGKKQLEEMNFRDVSKAIQNSEAGKKYREIYYDKLHKIKLTKDNADGKCSICGQKSTYISNGACKNCRNAFLVSLQIRTVLHNESSNSIIEKPPTGKAARTIQCKACGKIETVPSGIRDESVSAANLLCSDCAKAAKALKMSHASFIRNSFIMKVDGSREGVMTEHIQESSFEIPDILKALSRKSFGIKPKIDFD